MQTISTDVCVIGGGATGLGALRDLALRGMRAVLVERGDLASGTTGRYHGLLHSGGRYVSNDPQSATECARENAILRQIMPHCIEDTSGFFVLTPWDDPEYGDRFVASCRTTGVPVREVPLDELFRREPALNPQISRAFEVADGAADSFLAAHTNARAAQAYGAQILTYHRVTALIREADSIVGVQIEDVRSGEIKRIGCAYVLNAAGAWAGMIAGMADIPLQVVAGKGTMVAMNQRMVHTVINRCKLPADGDIIVPSHTVAVIGTTDIHVPDPDTFGITHAEIQLLLAEGEKLVPGFSHYRALRAWAGVRPLVQEESTPSAERDLSRTYRVFDHAARDGVQGIISIVGGKWTTYRLMAQDVVDLLAQRLGNTEPCRTAEEVLPVPDFAQHSTSGSHYRLGQPLAAVEQEHAYGDLICECELATRAQIEAAIAQGASNLDDIRRAVRMGMGPCQGGWCIYRTTALLYEQQPIEIDAANSAMLHFLQERWKGVIPVLWGDQLRQARLDEFIYVGVLGVDRLQGVK